MKIKNTITTLFALVSLFAGLAHAGAANVGVDQNDVTLAGYDAVAYFTENKAVEGSAEYTATYNNAIYRFSSEDNRNAFNENPAKYEPQFGGFCAYGAALGKKFDVNGKAFEIVDGKLYVNKSENVYETWLENKEENIVNAHTQWETIENVPAQDL